MNYQVTTELEQIDYGKGKISRTLIRCKTDYSTKAQSVNCLPYRARNIAQMLGDFKLVGGELSIEYCHSFSDAVDKIDFVLATTEKGIAAARGQIEEAGCELKLTDDEVAVMDCIVRHQLAESALEVDDPFNPPRSSVWNPPQNIPVPAPDLDLLFGEWE
jgi:hypothetical protein